MYLLQTRSLSYTKEIFKVIPCFSKYSKLIFKSALLKMQTSFRPPSGLLHLRWHERPCGSPGPGAGSRHLHLPGTWGLGWEYRAAGSGDILKVNGIKVASRWLEPSDGHGGCNQCNNVVWGALGCLTGPLSAGPNSDDDNTERSFWEQPDILFQRAVLGAPMLGPISWLPNFWCPQLSALPGWSRIGYLCLGE